MTAFTGKRELPRRPHPDHLRKQAKVRLNEMRASDPDTRLADAQLALAHDYGFATWGRLQAEVSLRAATARDWRSRMRRRRNPFTARYRERQTEAALLEPAAQPEAQTPFFLSGAGTSIGVLFVCVAIVMSVWALLIGITG